MYNPKTQFSTTHNHQNLNFRNPGTTNSVGPDSELAQNYESTHNNQYDQKTLQFRHNHRQQAMESDNSGVNSPKSPSHPLLGHRSPSPNPRAQAIARGQWELMEMVKNMPESSYELSLKDLVEHHRIENDHQDDQHNQIVAKLKKQEQSKKINDHRNVRSYENKGVFLNMVFPFSFKSNRKKGKFGSNNSGKVSPKPESERDWWKKRFMGSSDSDSSRTNRLRIPKRYPDHFPPIVSKQS
ncbi:hypothetical protein DH2020_007235 [Rehmannia glutinosa]|uniref:Uncharacterized protein n=1 Tax=Rehmannia glutinosa TaxID=99300 RepID=A0ABR0TXG9_REHGL